MRFRLSRDLRKRAMVWFRARTRPVSEARNAVMSVRNVIKRPPLRVVLANGASEDRSVKRLRSLGVPVGIEKARSMNGLGAGTDVPHGVHATGLTGSMLRD